MHRKSWVPLALGALLGLAPVPAEGAARRRSPASQSGAPRCQPLQIEAGVDADGWPADRFTWSDAACQPRAAELARHGFLRSFTYQVDGAPRRCSGSQPGSDWPGWGFVVCHYAKAYSNSLDTPAAVRTLFRGRHHAVHEFKVTVEPGGPVDVTIHWVFSTGRVGPVYAITHAPRRPLSADARAPYGNLNFDGDPSGRGLVAALGWGDRYRFRTTGPGPVTPDSPWDYSQPNLVPHVWMQAAGADAEMGAVATQTFAEHQGGGDYAKGKVEACWGRTSAARGRCLRWEGGRQLPPDWLWPMQLSQYELPVTRSSHRMAWGLSVGAVGQARLKSFGETTSGYPYQSYAVYLVLGPHSARPVEALLEEVATRRATALEASPGTVVAAGPGGAGRTDQVTWPQPGFDPAWAAWTLRAAGGKVAARFRVPADRRLPNPVLRVLDWSSGKPPARVTLDGRPLRADVDYFASPDPEGTALWLTLARNLAGTADLALE